MRVLTNGIITNYALDGPADAPVVTLSHSLAASLEMWEPQLPALAERYRVLRYDTRGHGGSEAPPGAYTLRMLAEDVVALLAALDVPRTHFIGLSMGGMIGQTLAIEHPEVLSSLVLADTASRIPPEMGPLWDQRVATAQSRGMAVSADDTIARWFTASFIAGSPEVVDGIRSLIRTTAPSGFAGCCRAIQDLDTTERLGEIALPTLIIVGENDMGTPVAVSELMHQRIAGSKLVVIGPAAHLSNVEQAEKFNRAVRSFLDGL